MGLKRDGRRNFFVLCIIIFTVSSFLCGAAPSLPMLLLFRVIQGIGGGGMQPMASHHGDSFEPQKRGQAFALYGLVAVLAPSIGPTLAAGLPIISPGAGSSSSTFRWHPGLLSGLALVEDPPWIKATAPGCGAWTTRFWLSHHRHGGMQIMLDKAKKMPGSPPASSLRCCSVCRGMIALIWWSGHKNPLINIKLFRYRNFAICCFLMMLVAAC